MDKKTDTRWSSNRLKEQEEDDEGECEIVMCCVAGFVLLLAGAVVVIAIAPAVRHGGHKVVPRTSFPATVKTKTAFEVKSFSSKAVEKALHSEHELESHLVDCTNFHPKKGAKQKNSIDLLVLVHSDPKAISELRNRVRMSWKKELPTGVEVVFVVPAQGMPQNDVSKLTEECQNYKDMVVFLNGPQLPQSEFFLLQLAWVSMRHINFHYMLKTREFMYVDLSRMMTDLIPELKRNRSNTYLGYFRADVKIRSKKGPKMHPEPNWVLCDKFIRYAHSNGYILSHELMLRLHSLNIYLYPYNNEHIALATWLSPYKDVDWYHDIRFNTEAGMSRGCRNDWLVFQSNNLLLMHQKLQSFAKPCGATQWEESQTYSFNFDTPPSNCCSRVVFH